MINDWFKILFHSKFSIQSKRVIDESSDESEPVIIEISDDESVTVEAMAKTENKKRTLPSSHTQSKSKYFKPSDAHGNEIKAKLAKQTKAANEAVKNRSNNFNEIMPTINGDTDNNDDVSSLSDSIDPALVFPND